MSTIKTPPFKKKKLALHLGSALALSVGVALSAVADLVNVELNSSSCGITVNPGEQALLTEDLSCVGSALTVDSTADNPARLNLDGHTVRCFTGVTPPTSLIGIGIQLIGEGAYLNNGSVTGCEIGVEVAGDDDGHHQVVNVQANGNGNGFVVNSDNNHLANNVASGNTTDDSGLAGNGFTVFGSSNEFHNNTANDNTANNGASAGTGFVVLGSSNKFRNNTANDNTNMGDSSSFSGNGFLLGITSSTLSNNTANNNGEYGINVIELATGNTLEKNKAFDNTLADLFDGNLNCDGNVWSKNKFDTSDPASGCIE